MLACSLAGCSRTIGEAHPHSASYATNDVAGRYQGDIRLVLASPDDEGSRHALRCILSFAYRARLLELKVAQAKDHVPHASERERRPPMPDGGDTTTPEDHCASAAASSDATMAGIGRRYQERIEQELGVRAEKRAADAIALDEVEALVAQANHNAALRRLLPLKRHPPEGELGERLAAIEAANAARFAAEAAFEAKADIRVLRRREMDLEDAARTATARGMLTSRAREDLRDVRDAIAEKHDAFVAERGFR